MYNKIIIDRLNNLTYLSALKNSNITAITKKNAYGDIVKFYAQINKQNVIQGISFKATGCSYFVALCSYFCEIVDGKTIDEALKIKDKDLIAFAELDESRYHIYPLILDTFALLIKKYRKGVEAGKITPCEVIKKVKVVETKPKTVEKKVDVKDGLHEILVSEAKTRGVSAKTGTKTKVPTKKEKTTIITTVTEINSEITREERRMLAISEAESKKELQLVKLEEKKQAKIEKQEKKAQIKEEKRLAKEQKTVQVTKTEAEQSSLNTKKNILLGALSKIKINNTKKDSSLDDSQTKNLNMVSEEKQTKKPAKVVSEKKTSSSKSITKKETKDIVSNKVKEPKKSAPVKKEVATKRVSTPKTVDTNNKTTKVVTEKAETKTVAVNTKTTENKSDKLVAERLLAFAQKAQETTVKKTDSKKTESKVKVEKKSSTKSKTPAKKVKAEKVIVVESVEEKKELAPKSVDLAVINESNDVIVSDGSSQDGTQVIVEHVEHRRRVETVRRAGGNTTTVEAQRVDALKLKAEGDVAHKQIHSASNLSDMLNRLHSSKAHVKEFEGTTQVSAKKTVDGKVVDSKSAMSSFSSMRDGLQRIRLNNETKALPVTTQITETKTVKEKTSKETKEKQPKEKKGLFGWFSKK
ncbi:MAG: hypothetical protein E7354_01265 [Clostridiales bacterium]|nr:hypothetical protein [Clostridiales bacterium]